jgi:hypothetical protein
MKAPDIPQKSRSSAVQKKKKKKTAKCSVSSKAPMEDEWATRKKDAAIAQARARILPPRETKDTTTRKKTNKPK